MVITKNNKRYELRNISFPAKTFERLQHYIESKHPGNNRALSLTICSLVNAQLDAEGFETNGKRKR